MRRPVSSSDSYATGTGRGGSPSPLTSEAADGGDMDERRANDPNPLADHAARPVSSQLALRDAQSVHRFSQLDTLPVTSA